MPEGAIYVGRTTAGRSLDYGNRYAVGESVHHVNDTMVTVRDRAHAVSLYREWYEWQRQNGYAPDLGPLIGHDLVCWCGLDQPCHADVLLELANPEAFRVRMAERLGSRQLDLLVTLAGIKLALVVPDKRSAGLVRRGLLAAEQDGSFAHITARGLRVLADEIDAGRVTLFNPLELKRERHG